MTHLWKLFRRAAVLWGRTAVHWSLELTRFIIIWIIAAMDGEIPDIFLSLPAVGLQLIDVFFANECVFYVVIPSLHQIKSIVWSICIRRCGRGYKSHVMHHCPTINFTLLNLSLRSQNVFEETIKGV